MGYYACYAKAIAIKQDQRGRAFLFCWLDGDEPDKKDPDQAMVPPDQRITPMPIPLTAIAPQSEVKQPGDEGKLVVLETWAAAAGLVHEDEAGLGGIFS